MPIVPSAITVTGGSASVATNGVVTFTGISNVYLQGIFTSAYRDYFVICDFSKNGTSAADNVGFQLANGTTESSSLYSVASAGSAANTTTTYQFGGYQGAYAAMTQAYYASQPGSFAVNISAPALAQWTSITGTASGVNGTVPVGTLVGGRHEVATAYNTLKALVTGNSMTGTIQVFGYRN